MIAIKIAILMLLGHFESCVTFFTVVCLIWNERVPKNSLQCSLSSLSSWCSVPVGNRSRKLDHLVRSLAVPETTTRGAFLRGKLYEVVCELYRKNAVTQVI